MGSSSENTLTNFDLDLFLCSASSSLTENTEHGYQTQNMEMAGSISQSNKIQNMEIARSTEHGFQVQNMGCMGTVNQGYIVQNIGITGTTNHSFRGQNMGSISTANQGYQVQNIGITGTTNTGYQIQNMRNELLLSLPSHADDKAVKNYDALKIQLQKISVSFVSLQNDHESLNKDYQSLKEQYFKVASDYASLHNENKEHAMAHMNISAKCESLELNEAKYLATIDVLRKQCEKYSLDIYAQSKQFLQFQSHVEELSAKIIELKNNVKSEKNNGRDSRKVINALTKNNDTLADHLCLFACVIEGRRPIDKDTRRFIKKYCKKSTESFENQSVDTGRGSSLGFSDGERGFYSPSYSISLSPFSNGGTTPRNERTKMTKESSCSPIPMAKTIDISTSPIIFEKLSSIPLAIQACDVATNTIILDEAKQTRDNTTSPIAFDDKRTPVTETSPEKFDGTSSPLAMTQSRSFTTSPMEFDDVKSPLDDAQTWSITASPTKFEVTRTKTLDMAISPIMFDDTETRKAKTLNIATSPIMFQDTGIPVIKIITSNIATSPVDFEDVIRPTSIRKTANIATSPIAFEGVARHVNMTKTSNIATSPIIFDYMKSLTVMPTTSNTATSPIAFEGMQTSVSCLFSSVTKTSSIATSPIKFDDRKSLTARTTTSNIATSPIAFEDLRTPVNKTKTSNSATSPIHFAVIRTPESKKTPVISATSPMEFADAKIPATETRQFKLPDMASSFNRSDAKTTKTRTKYANASTSALTTKTINTASSSSIENAKPLSFYASIPNTHHIEDIVKNPARMSMCTDFKTKTALHINKITEKLKEIVSKQEDHTQDDADWEIQMILSKHRLNWALLSPMSLSPEINQENEQSQYKRKSETKESINQHLFGDEDSDDEIDSEDCNTRHLPIENPHHEVTPNEISSQNRAHKNPGTSTKNKKLTNLQKIYKANVPKTKIKSSLSPVKKQGKRPKPHSIPPIIANSVATLLAEGKDKKFSELKSKTSLFISQDGADKVSKESIKSSYKEPSLLPETNMNKMKKTSSLLHTQANLQSESDPKKRVCMSETTFKTSSLPYYQASPSESVQKKKVSNSGLAHAQTNPLTKSEEKASSESKKSECMSTETQSNNISVLESNAKKICQSTESSSNKVQTNQPSESGPRLDVFNNTENDIAYTVPNPTAKRISRVKKGITTVPPISSNNQIDSNNTNDRISDTINYNNNGDSQCLPLKRPASDPVVNDELDIKRKRIHQKAKSDLNMDTSEEVINESVDENKSGARIHQLNTSPDAPNFQNRNHADYNDMAMFTASNVSRRKKRKNDEIPESWTHSILDRMLYKYAANPGQANVLKCDDLVVLKIKTGIAICVKSMNKQDEYAKNLQNLVQELLVLGKKTIISGLMTFIKDPACKGEFILVTKNTKGYLTEPTASPTEMALIDVIQLMETSGVVLWDLILDSFEFILFTLEKGATPVFDVIDSVSHLYANICRYRRNISRIWMFMLNAMYCLSFKAVPIIKHCLDVMPEVLPFANKTIDPGLKPLITCLVFLLNFYNCEDPYKRMEEIRRRLKNKYYYNLQDENETTLLFLLRGCVINLTENKLERDMLELSFLIVAKRRGTKWCHKHIVQKILLPFIKGEIEVSYRARRFCITTIGYIMKPYNNEMSVHTEEVVNLLINIFNQEPQQQELKEDIIRGLINMNMKSIAVRINACLKKWNPPSVSHELEEALETYIRRKANIRSWFAIYQDHFREK